MLYIAYIDEFGHIGPYKSHDDLHYKTHPGFGLGGIVLPYNKVREFSTFFFKLKTNLLSFEIKKAGTHPAKWEKKGSSLYTTKNIEKYKELRKATNRILNTIYKLNGYVFYVGQKKIFEDKIDSKKLYSFILQEAIKRLNQECLANNDEFMIIIDEQENNAKKKHESMRAKIVETSALAMFGGHDGKCLIEPPIQAESHLYQNLQCADWICGLIGRLAYYDLEPNNNEDLEWVNKYFRERIMKVSKRSSIRKPKSMHNKSTTKSNTK